MGLKKESRTKSALSNSDFCPHPHHPLIYPPHLPFFFRLSGLLCASVPLWLISLVRFQVRVRRSIVNQKVPSWNRSPEGFVRGVRWSRSRVKKVVAAAGDRSFVRYGLPAINACHCRR